jgi:DNA-directed RNA polymerase subunit RPC12/RpoP
VSLSNSRRNIRTTSRNMTAEYSCPACSDDVTVGDNQEVVRCPSCEVRLLVSRDAEFRDGSWRDLTTLTPREEVCPNCGRPSDDCNGNCIFDDAHADAIEQLDAQERAYERQGGE